MTANNLSKKEIAEQTTLAFSFIQKLYQESSYLVKEIEGLLKEEEQNFQILKPSGYGISTRSSTGFDAVYLWMLRKYAVGFVSNNQTKIERGATVTAFRPDLKVLYYRIILDDKTVSEPKIYAGVFYDIVQKQNAGWVKKFENLMGHFEYNDLKVFKSLDKVEYEDSVVKMRGKFIECKLLDINSSEEVVKKIVEPSLKIYNQL